MATWLIRGPLIRQQALNGDVFTGDALDLYDKNSMQYFQWAKPRQAHRDGNWIDAVWADRDTCPEYFSKVITMEDKCQD